MLICPLLIILTPRACKGCGSILKKKNTLIRYIYDDNHTVIIINKAIIPIQS